MRVRASADQSACTRGGAPGRRGGATLPLVDSPSDMKLCLWVLLPSAVAAVGDDRPCVGLVHLDTHPLVEDVAETVEVPSFHFRVFAIRYDSTIELIDVVKSFLFD